MLFSWIRMSCQPVIWVFQILIPWIVITFYQVVYIRQQVVGTLPHLHWHINTGERKKTPTFTHVAKMCNFWSMKNADTFGKMNGKNMMALNDNNYAGEKKKENSCESWLTAGF